MELLSFKIDRDELAERFGGGLPRGSLVVIEGEYGAGKSILTQRLTYGLIMNDVSVTLLSTELTTAGFLDQIMSLQYDLEEALVNERLVFLSVHPIFGQTAPRGEALQRIVEARKMYEKDVVIFDCFSKFLADHAASHAEGRGPMEGIEGALRFFKRLTSLGKTIILTFESGQVSPQIASIFKESADVFLSLRFELVGNSASRRIIVHRLSRAKSRFGDIIGYRVEPGVGLVIEIKSVV